MLPAAIFDFDGVIVDSEKIHFLTFKTTLAEFGITISKERWYKEFTGIGSKNILRILFQENRITESIDLWFEKRRTAFFDYVHEYGVEIIPGIDNFLSELKKNKVKTAIATGSGRNVISFVLENIALTEYFDAAVTADDVVNKKPHPEVFLTAASLIDTNPMQCVAFEDSKNGVASAKAAGMKIVGLESPSLPEKECNIVITDFRNFSLDKMQKLF